MICKDCGCQNDFLTLEPVFPTRRLMPSPERGASAVKEVCYARWACQNCGRYHFPDGSLYSNPFKDQRRMEDL